MTRSFIPPPKCILPLMLHSSSRQPVRTLASLKEAPPSPPLCHQVALHVIDSTDKAFRFFHRGSCRGLLWHRTAPNGGSCDTGLPRIFCSVRRPSRLPSEAASSGRWRRRTAGKGQRRCRWCCYTEQCWRGQNGWRHTAGNVWLRRRWWWRWWWRRWRSPISKAKAEAALPCPVLAQENHPQGQRARHLDPLAAALHIIVAIPRHQCCVGRAQPWCRAPSIILVLVLWHRWQNQQPPCKGPGQATEQRRRTICG